MIYCFDTYYFSPQARTACLGFASWEDAVPVFERIEILSDVAEYESGAFYKRELPCITSVLDKMELNPAEDCIIVDGFVVLDDTGKRGLGGYLFDHLNQEIPVIGVAKRDFFGLEKLKRPVLRGGSSRPLYVTASGMDLDEAAAKVASMHGEFRFPTLLKLLDQKSRAL